MLGGVVPGWDAQPIGSELLWPHYTRACILRGWAPVLNESAVDTGIPEDAA